MSGVALQLDHVTKRFGKVLAVDDLSLEVREGEVFGLLGPNGAGKTTSINMICGLLRPDEGQVLVHGRAVRDDADVLARVGVCPQNVVLWSNLTCLEQLGFVGEMYGLPRRVARNRGEALLAVMGLADRRDWLAKALSGGMQRRLNLLMALVHDPDVVVLDEPEAGLDPQSRVLLRDYIRSMARKKTVILTTHNMDEAERVADRVGIIDHGRLLVVDTPDALKRRIGEGDVLEIEVSGVDAPPGLAAAAVGAVVGGATAVGGTVVVRARGVVEMLPAILDALRDCGARPGEVRLRESTLEDVFISLTGRRLRE